MNRKVVGIVAAACALIMAGCATKTELTREERVEKLRQEARLADQEQFERTLAAKRQLQYEGKTAASGSKPM